jgi:hypothetical protein
VGELSQDLERSIASREWNYDNRGQRWPGHSRRSFVSAAKESVRAVDIAVRDVETGKVSCGRPMNSRIYGLPSTQRAVDVLDELKPEGYVFGSNSD